MDLLLDQDVYAKTAAFLIHNGHNVVTASQIGHETSSDTILLKKAKNENRLFITRDKDFGGLVFTKKIKTGVILLRVSPATLRSSHKELNTVLTEYDFDELVNNFIVVLFPAIPFLVGLEYLDIIFHCSSFLIKANVIGFSNNWLFVSPSHTSFAASQSSKLKYASSLSSM